VLIDRHSTIVGHSDGQSLLLSLTFISALISIAKDRAGSKGYILQPGAIAPFVIDAPFGVLDTEYRSNVASEVPKSSEQVIFLLSSSHWDGAVDNVIKDRVGAEYNMCLHVASEIKENVISKLRVREKEYVSVIYNAECDMTTIEEIGPHD